MIGEEASQMRLDGFNTVPEGHDFEREYVTGVRRDRDVVEHVSSVQTEFRQLTGL